MNCVIEINFEVNPTLKTLANYCAKNNSKFYSYIEAAFDEISSDGKLKLSKDFKDKIGYDDISSVSGVKLKNDIIKYYNTTKLGVNTTSRKVSATFDGKMKPYDKAIYFGYVDIQGRMDVIKSLRWSILSHMNNIENVDNVDKSVLLGKEYIKNAYKYLKDTVLHDVAKATKKSIKEIKEEYKKDGYSVIQQIVDKSDLDLQTLNRIAAFNEFRRYYLSDDESKNYGKEFVDELLSVEEFSSIRKSFNEEDVTQENNAITEEDVDTNDNPEDNVNEYEADTYIQVLSNKLGITTTFETHIGSNLKTLLNSLPNLIDGERLETGKFDKEKNPITVPNFDLNNNSGLPTGMNSNQCATVIYNHANYANKEDMLESIKNIAYTIPGMAGFHSLYNILKNNKDLLTEFYCTFSKITIDKIETITDSDKSVSRDSNRTANKRSALIFDYLNSIKTATAKINLDFAKQDLDNIKKLYNKYDTIKKGSKNKELEEQLESEIYKQLKRYYNVITKNTIHNYIYLHNQGDIKNPIITKQNILNLISYIERTINTMKDGRISYEQRQASINEMNRRNYYKEQEAEKLNKNVKKSELEDVSILYAESYITDKQESTIIDLSKELLDYTLVNTDLNSRNAKGNQSSNVINSSMITYLKNILESKLNTETNEDSPLNNFGKYKFQSQQYDFSNILLEQKVGNKVIYGLFRKVNGKFVPTEYANELLQFSLFDGASNYNDDTHEVYADMSKGDYISTAWINYFTDFKSISKLPLGSYFFRIPSDAPKNFIMRAPKYDVSGLINDDLTNINKNNIVFQALRRIFIQELTDAATATDVLFEQKIEKDNTKIIGFIDGKPALKNNRKNDDVSDLHPTYHYGKSGKIIENGKLTGKVFSSDRFIVYDEATDTETNYGEKILEEAFDFFYGGANGSTNRHNYAFRYKENNDGKLEVVISTEQNEVIDKYISEFIKDYIRIGKNRLSEFKDLLKTKDVTTKNVADFMLNHHIAYVAMNDLLEGDTKFYKDTQTFLKRAKESQGSGVPYGITDFNSYIGAPKIEIDSILNSTVFGPNQDYRVKQYNKFTAVTIKNTVKTDKPMIKRMVEVLTDKEFMGINVLSTKKAKELMAGYEETIINDAQSYITFDEWIRRITARGQLHKYQNLINKILDENSILSIKDIKEFVQVQKNFYYDQHYNPSTRTVSPRQIKNAELVLVPRFIKGTELELVEKLMKKYGIDQLNTEETSKAGKSYVLEIFDENTGIIKNDIVKELSSNKDNKSEFGKLVNDAKEEFDYNFLYTQQETPQHIHAENKAGIQVMKKLFDNINPNSPLQTIKNEFFEIYGENIYESFYNVMQELNVPLDENGNIKTNSIGEIEGINWDKFYDRLRDELIRLGSDSNMTDYFTQSDTFTNETLMPNYYSLNGDKLENIAQALFNRNITRQTLPGFHAAQVTSVGYRIKGPNGKYDTSDVLQYHPLLYTNNTTKVTITEKEYKKLSKEEQTNFTKSGIAPYIEVLLPAANFGFDRNSESVKDMSVKEQNSYFLAQLEKEKLDKIIGYRIPTEGKQSVCIMKVVGFTDDAQGSTIVVPDAWVSQTGSDFDIDSVYGIQHSSYVDKFGTIHRIDYTDNDEKNYWTYLRNKLGKDTWNKIIDAVKLTDEEKQEIIDKYTDNDGIINWYEAKKDLKSNYRENLIAELEYYIKKENLLYFEDFKKLPKVKKNSREARNTRICDIMIEILSSPDALEENLSRSNSDDIKDSLKKCSSESRTKERNARSAYNFLDQAAFQEDAMSGARLKAKSVIRDTMVSVANTVKPHLDIINSINVFYPKSKYNYNELVKRFGEKYVEKYVDMFEEGYIVKHVLYGHSEDNRNVDNKILTAYSSQTTAFILDAIKTGNIPNVNDLTFGTFKTIVDFGSNYDTAMSFIMQPGVKRIVNAYNTTNSIYSSNKNKNYIDLAIVSIAKDLEIEVNDNSTREEILKKIENKYGKLEEFVLNAEKQIKRLKTSTPVGGTTDDLLYDLSVILKYEQLSNISDNIDNLARISNPDKFGAKQTIFATNAIFDTLGRYAKGKKSDLYTEDGADFVFALYPFILNYREKYLATYGIENLDEYELFDFNEENSLIEEALKSNPKDSAYPPLAAFIKYATATSIAINRNLFKTQQPGFRKAINNLSLFTTNHRQIDENTYKAFKNYIIQYLVNSTRFISTPLHYELGTGFTYNSYENGEINTEEVERIYGYNKNPNYTVNVNGEDIEFNVKDINNPTQDELNIFEKLSPAQKVSWLKENIRENDQGILQYVNVSLFNDRASRRSNFGSQTISFASTNTSIEQIYSDFEQGYRSTNPLIAMTHADIVKYAFVVEGYRIGMKNVSKMIPNSILMEGGPILGTNMVNETNYKINNIQNIINDNELMNRIMSNFIRSHSTIPAIGTKFVKFNPKTGFDLIRRGGERISIIQIGKTKEGYEILKKYGFAYETKIGKETEYKLNKYGKLSFQFDKDTILYELIADAKTNNFYLIPINKLETNENSEWSANPANDKFNARNFYLDLIKKYEDAHIGQVFNSAQFRETINSIKKEEDYKEKYLSPNEKVKLETLARPFTIEEKLESGYYNHLAKAINDWINNDYETEELVHFNGGLDKHIFGFGKKYALFDSVLYLTQDGKQKPLGNYSIYRYDPYKLIVKYVNDTIEYEADNKTVKHVVSNLNRDISKLDNIEKQIVENLRQRRILAGRDISRNINDVYIILPNNVLDTKVSAPDLVFSDILDESAADAVAAINRDLRKGEQEAIYSARKFKEEGITSEKEVVKVNTNRIISLVQPYIVNKAKAIEDKLNRFMLNGEGIGLPITHPDVIKEVKRNRKLRKEFVEAVLAPIAFLQEYQHFTALNITSEDKDIQYDLQKIQNAINSIQTLPIRHEAFKLYSTQYMDKISNAPMIKGGATKEGAISVLDGFYDSCWADVMFNDIQESVHPLIQITMKEYMNNSRADYMNSVEEARNFRTWFNNITKEAENNGKTIDLNKIFDEYGRFRQSFTNKFIEDNKHFYNKMIEAKQKVDKTKDFDPNYIDYLKARLEYNEWLAENTEQEIVREYYNKINKAEREILYGRKSFNSITGEEIIVDASPELYAKYEQLRNKRLELIRRLTNDEPDAVIDAEISKINKEIESLTSNYYNDPISGKFILKDDTENVILTTSEDRLRYAITSIHHATILKNFIQIKIDANNEYYTTAEVLGFEDKLRHNLSIIRERELRNPDGTPKFNEAQLARDEEYQKAKSWILRNTYRVVDDTTGWKKELDSAYKTLNKEFDVDGTKKGKVAWNPKLTSGSIDSDGVLDARTLTDEEISDLRDEELRLYHNSEDIPFSDRILMSNGNPDKDVVYNNAFYRSLAAKTKIDKEANALWFKTITEINDLLAPYWDSTLKRVMLNKIPNTKEGIDTINKLRELYDKLERITKATYEDDETRIAHKNWLDENVDIIVNEEAYNNDLLWIKGQKNEYGRALNRLIKNLNPTFEVVPNTYLYGYIKPKGDTFKEFKTGKTIKSVNKVKVDALATIRKYVTSTPTKYYYDKFNEMASKSNKEFAEWYYANHIYNGYTHQFQPLRCWTKVQYGESASFNYVPNFNQTNRIPKKEYANPNYRKGSINLNYNKDSHNYDNKLNLNEYEQEVSDHIHELLNSLVNENQSKRYIEEGWLPSRKVYDKMTPENIGKQILKLLGTYWGNETESDFYGTIQYYKHSPKIMPMLSQIADKHKAVNKKVYPKKDDPDYEEKLKEWKEEEERVNKENLELHKKLHDKDYISVIEEFILKAGLYNSIQNNSYMLFYALEALKQYGNYTQKYWAFGDLKKGIGSSKEDKVYAKQIDNQLIKQLEVTINRLVYNQWKQPYGKVSKFLNLMQSYTSSTYMMLNLKGGIANITLGESQIISEAFAREFFNNKEKAAGDLEYDKAIYDYILHAYDDKAGTKQGAYIKFMDCVDYDEHNGEVKIANNPNEVFEKIRSLGFTMQTAGEHKMQNSALLSMSISHRLVENPRSEEFGQPKYMFANLNEYTNIAHESAFISILDDKQLEQYNKFKDDIKKDANILKDYAWYRKDFATEFAIRLDKTMQKKFIEAKNKIKKELKDKFENDELHPTIYSQLKCGTNGYLEFVEGSKLAELNIKKDDGPSDAYRLLAEFKGRVISVNKKIHGVYDKSGRAQIESIIPGGSLIMQYHKHIPMAITKRYRMKGMFSEERGTVDKGIYTSIYDFLSIPFKRHQALLEMNDEEVNTAIGIQNIVKEVLDFAFNMRHYYSLLQDYDRANIRRGFGNLLGVVGSVFLAIAAKCLMDDDDDSWLYNISMYEADRLATEATQYSILFPTSSFSELKKQLQSPIAASNGVQDLLNSVSMLCQLMLQGDDFDPEYHSGQFAGENKLTVYLQRRIPLWRGIKSAFIDIYDNNSYYKVGKNVFGYINLDNTIDAFEGKDVRPW